MNTKEQVREYLKLAVDVFIDTAPDDLTADCQTNVDALQSLSVYLPVFIQTLQQSQTELDLSEAIRDAQSDTKVS